MNVDYKTQKDYVYFLYNNKLDNTRKEEVSEQNISNETLDHLLKTVGREVLKERTPVLAELESILQEVLQKNKFKDDINDMHKSKSNEFSINNEESKEKKQVPIISLLIKKGYLRESDKWLSSKGFKIVGEKILQDVMKELKGKDFGLHETRNLGSGSLILDTTKRYEVGNDIRLIDVPRSLLNSIQRLAKNKKKLNIPIEIDVEDFEEYETTKDVKVAVVYCIDLSSTMRYSTLYGDLSRIEAAKKALWTLYLLNRKYFPSDVIEVLGFGALASKVKPSDIPYLKTFEPGTDFLHYTNYQAALRLGKKILNKYSVESKRIVLITDGHPSACFINTKNEKEKMLSQRPYSNFYIPDDETKNLIKQTRNMELEVKFGELVYLCYRYRQVDQFIGERTIIEAKKCKRSGINVDTIMISEEDSLLNYVNEMEKSVNGRSYYINPEMIDKILLTDYINNKKSIIHK